MLPTIPIGPLRLQTYGLFLLVAYMAGLWLAARLASSRGIDRDHVYNAGFYALLGGLVGARLGHVVAFFEVYRNDPLEVLSLSPGALLPLPGMVLGGAILVVYVRRQRLPWKSLADAAAPGMLLAIAIADFGAWLAGRRLGAASDLPWAMELFGIRRHPAALYEALGVLLLLVLILLAGGFLRLPGQRASAVGDGSEAPSGSAQKGKHPEGWLALLALFGYATLRLLIEPLFMASPVVGDGWRVPQLIALATVAVTGWLLGRMAGARRSEPA